MKDTPHRVWDHNLQAMRDLAEDEWELESHWAGALEVHGKKMPGHDWIVVVPKYKLTAAEAVLTAAEERLNECLRASLNLRCDERTRAEQAEAALAEARAKMRSYLAEQIAGVFGADERGGADVRLVCRGKA